jgi:hypothetical protein
LNPWASFIPPSPYSAGSQASGAEFDVIKTQALTGSMAVGPRLHSLFPGRNTIHAGHPFNSGSSHFLDSQVSFFIYILFILEVIDGGSVLPGNIAEEEMLFRTLFNPVWDSGPKEMKLFSISLYAPERVLCTLAASLSASELHEARLAASACEPYCRFFFCLMICNFLGQ